MDKNLSEKDEAILSQLIDPDQSVEAKYTWDEDFQRVVLGLLLCDKFFLSQSLGLIKPTYFSIEAHQVISRILFDYYNKYSGLPSKVFVKQELISYLERRYKERKDTYEAVRLLYLTELNRTYDYYTRGGVGNLIPGLDSNEAILDKITGFARTQATKNAFYNCFNLMRKKNTELDDTWEEIGKILNESQLVNRQFDLGLDYFGTIEERYARMEKVEEDQEYFTTGFDTIDRSLNGGMVRGDLGAWMGKPGGGKTWIEETEILMYDGTIKKVEDIKVGDLVMGNDSTPRKVLNTHSLVDNVYEIKPVKGESYFVNGKHVLSLKDSHRQGLTRDDRPTKRRKNPPFEHHFARMGKTNIYNISVEDWLKQSIHFKTKMKGWRAGVDWPFKKVKIDPYFLGLWLGDGFKNTSGLCSVDDEIIEHTKKVAAKLSLNIRIKEDDYYIYSEENRIKPPGKGFSKNVLLNDLRSYNLINNNHIPFEYKINDRKTRLKVLAGLIDSDGSKGNNCYYFVNKNKVLASDVLFLARSLGFAAYMRECVKKCQTGKSGHYWRISISGDCSQIPVRVKRKKCSKRRQIKDHLLTGIKIIDRKKLGKFYGFETDGNHLLLLSDFTVVHNSLALSWASIKNVQRGHKVLYITTEMDPDRVASRFDSQMSVIGQHELLPRRSEVWRALREEVEYYEDKKRLIIKHFPSGTAGMSDVRAFYSQLSIMSFKPDLLIVDYPGDLKEPSGDVWEARYKLLREIKGFGGQEKHCTMIAIHPNRNAAKLDPGEYIDEATQGDSFKQFQVLDCFWTLNQSPAQHKAGFGEVFIAKGRGGKSRFPFFIEYGFKDQTLTLREVSERRYKIEMQKATERDVQKTDTKIDDVDAIVKPYDPDNSESERFVQGE